MAIKDLFTPGRPVVDALGDVRRQFPELAGLEDRDLRQSLGDTYPELAASLNEAKPAEPLAVSPETGAGPAGAQTPAGTNSDLKAVRQRFGLPDDLPDDVVRSVLSEKYPDQFPPTAPEVVQEPAKPLGASVKGVAQSFFKNYPERAEGHLLDHLLSLSEGATEIPVLPGVKVPGKLGKDAALASVLELAGFYKGLTGIRLDVDPDTLQAVEDRQISPKIADAAGEMSGGLALLMGAGAALRSTKAGEAVFNGFSRTPQLARVLKGSTTAALDFAGAAGFKEGIDATMKGGADPLEVGKRILKEGGMGVGFGGVQAGTAGKFENAAADHLAQATGATAFGYSTALAQGADHASAAIAGLSAGFYALLGAKDATNAQKIGAFKTALNNVDSATRTEAQSRGYNAEDQDALASAAKGKFTDFVNRIKAEDVPLKNWDKVSADVHAEMKAVFDKIKPTGAAPGLKLVEASAGEPVPGAPGTTPPAPPASTEPAPNVPPVSARPGVSDLSKISQEARDYLNEGFPTVVKALGLDAFPVPPEVLEAETVAGAKYIKEAVAAGATPEAAQREALFNLVDSLYAKSGLKTVPHGTPGALPPIATPGEIQPELGQGSTLERPPVSLSKEPHELAYADFKALYGDGRPEAEIKTDFRQTIRNAVKAGADVPAENVAEMRKLKPEKPVKFDERGIPVRKPTDVVTVVHDEHGQRTAITHAMIIEEAKGLQDEIKANRGEMGPLERFVIENGGIRGFKNGMEKEEFRGVPVRARGIKAPDEMAQQAYDAGILIEPSSDLLVNELADIDKRGEVPPLGELYDEALRRLEHFSQSTEAFREKRANYHATPPDDMFGLAPENLSDTFKRLVEQNKKAGMGVGEALKAARLQLAKSSTERQAISSPEGPQRQGEFSAGDGVTGFGRGAKGEGELFEKRPRGYGSDFDKTVRAFADGIEKRYGVEFSAWEDNQENIHLAQIIVPKGSRRQGLGSAVMEDLVQFADAHHRPVVLSPDTAGSEAGTTSRGRLVEFYKRFGFVENKGRNKDYRISEGMIRRPTSSSGATMKEPAYHGSPYRFDKFSLNKIGTGEGHQAYGWGLYFSGEKAVAEYYRKMLTPPPEIPAGVRLVLGDAVDMLGFSTPAEAVQALRDEVAAGRDWKKTWDVQPARSEKEARAAKVIDDYLAKPVERGALYHVEIPEVDEFLDWDKPVNEQPERVRAALRPVIDEIAGSIKSESSPVELASTIEKMNGGELYQTFMRGRPREKSARLLAAGIPGLRYLDQNSRGKGGGKQTYNYVLFDDSRIQIHSMKERPQNWDARLYEPTGDVEQLSLALNVEASRLPAEKLIASVPQEPIRGMVENADGTKIDIFTSPWSQEFRAKGALEIPNKKITSPADIAFAFRFLTEAEPGREKFYVGAIQDGRVTSVELVAVGTVGEVNIHAREILLHLVKSGADSFFMVHNHPTGFVTPSSEDIRTTAQFRDLAKAAGIGFYGHVIIDDTQFGFIDPTENVATYEHKKYAKTHAVPLLEKYAEWQKGATKSDVKARPAITEPAHAYELFKGIQAGAGETLVAFTNVQNIVLKAAVIPKGALTPEWALREAELARASGIITVNAGVSTDIRLAVKSALKLADVNYFDDIIPNAGGTFRSAYTSGLMESKGEYAAPEPAEKSVLKEPDYGDEYKRVKSFEPQKDTTPEFIEKKRNAIKKFGKELLQSMSSRLGDIDPSLKLSMRKFESDYRLAIKRDFDRVRPFLEGMRALEKADPGDARVVDLAMKNGRSDIVSEIMRRHGVDVSPIHDLLEEMRKRIQAVGYEVGYVEGYFPRKVRDKKGLEKFIYSQAEVGGEIKAAIRDKSLELGRELNDDERVNLINSLIRGFVRSKVALARTSNMKTREIDHMTPELSQFYYSSREALVRYISEVNEAVEARKFFGRVEEKPNFNREAQLELAGMTDQQKKESALSFNNVQDSIGAFVNRLLEAKKITPNQQQELVELFRARFGYIGTHGLFGLYKNITYMDTIASPISAISNLEDLGICLYKAAWETPGSFIRALANRSKIKLEDLGLEVLAEEITEASKTASALRFLLHATGFTFLDRVGKETYLNAVIDRYRNSLIGKMDPRLEENLLTMFGPEADNVADDLRNGRLSDNVMFLAMNELSEQQPMTLSEVPQIYLESPGARVFYTLKTFMVKRLNFLRDEILKAPNVKESLKRGLKLYALMIIFGATIDELKDFILNRKTTFSDRMIDNFIKPFGISKYTLYRVRELGPAAALVDFFTPPHKLFDSIWRDVQHGGERTTATGRPAKPGYGGPTHERDLEITASIPIGGKLWYWWFGRGAQKTAEYQARNRAKAERAGKSIF